MKIEICNTNLTFDLTKESPNKLFVFEESANLNTTNSFGIKVDSFTDFKRSIIEQMIQLKLKSNSFESIVFSKYGYGNQKLKNDNSDAYNFLSELLISIFDFDNRSGSVYYRIPSHQKITTSEYVNFSDNYIINPINNSFFNPNFLESGLFTTYDLIRTENKISFTTTKTYNIGQTLILQFSNTKKYIVCEVVDVISGDLLNDYYWSSIEGFDIEFSRSIDRTNYNQILIKYICQLDESGNMIFREQLFSNQKSEIVDNQEEKKEEKSPVQNITNEDIFNILVQINKNLENLNKNFK